MHENPKIVGVTPNAAPRTESAVTVLVDCAPELMRQLGVDRAWLENQKNLAGEGSAAVAWWLPNSTHVLKVTTDPSDAAAAHLLLSSKETVPGLVKIHLVATIECADSASKSAHAYRTMQRSSPFADAERVYAIVADEVEPDPPSGPQVEALSLARVILMDLTRHSDMSVVADVFGSREAVKRFGSAYEEGTQALAAKYVQILATGLRWFSKRNFVVTDLNEDKLGWDEVRHEPVLIDFGSQHWEHPETMPEVVANVHRWRGPAPTEPAAGSHTAWSPRPNPLDIDHAKLLLKAPELMRSLGIDAKYLRGHRLGGGNFAVAWKLPDGCVLKITHDGDDAAGAERVLSGTQHGRPPAPGLPIIYSVHRLPGREPLDPESYAIVMEFAKQNRESEEIGTDAAVVDEGLGASEALRYPHRMRALLADFDFDQLKNEKKLDERVRHVSALMRGIVWLRKHGVAAADVYGSNIGWNSRGEIVMFDMGSGGGRARRKTPRVPLTKNGSMTKVRRAFDRCFDMLDEQFPDFGELELHEDDKAGSDNGHGSERQFGYCMHSKPIRIAFASKTEELPQANVDGLMAHEFGHALDNRYGKELPKMLGARLPRGAERRADAIAEAVFGKTIKYDAKLIQCVDCEGASPRPRKLGA